jgi:sulfotransferase
MKRYAHIVEYQDIIRKPQETLDAIYNFLEIPTFKHDFDNIINSTHEDDSIYGLNGMHDVRKSISQRMIDPYAILPAATIRKYSNMEVWRNV